MFGKINRRLNIRQPGQSRSPRDKGQSLVEMAIISPLLLLLFIGVLEVGWAIRGYIVLLNADREATRFAARGQYLDFRFYERDEIGYGYVLSHTLESMSEQLDFDVVSGDPNGTLIISHYLVDTAKPCADPPCNDDCDADKHNKHGGCDCSTPDRREEDYSYDDLILHPAIPGYEHFSALYGISRPSRLDHAQLVAELKEQNDAFNCSLNLKDESIPWVPNSAVVVEAWYDQPQLLGVPIISNYFTDPVPLYVNTTMRIASDRGSGGGESDGLGCQLWPIAVHTDTLKSKEFGDFIPNIREGTGSGNFGWLRWTDDTGSISSDPNSEQYLAEELANPKLAINDYREPEHKDPSDTVINAGDWVWGLTGNVNSNGVARTQLQEIIDEATWIRIPVYGGDPPAEGTGSNVVYHIVGFALFELEGYDLGGNPKEIWGIFRGWENHECSGNGH
jgi:hypothetical protein